MFEDAEIIHRYTRADAIADGVLVDADSIEDGICASAGFRVPVAFTRATWADTVEWNEDTETGKRTCTGQSETGKRTCTGNRAIHLSGVLGAGTRRRRPARGTALSRTSRNCPGGSEGFTVTVTRSGTVMALRAPNAGITGSG